VIPGGRETLSPTVRIRPAFVVFCLALALCAALTKTHAVSWNDGSRIATVDALVSDHSFAIDGSPFTGATGDKIRVHGRTYSDKPPLLAVLGAGVGTIAAVFGLTLRTAPGPALYLITLFTVGACFALGCAYAYAFQRRWGFDQRLAALVAAATGLGTLVLPYATVLSNHVPAGAMGLAGCYHVTFDRRPRRGALLGGVFFALAYAFDPGSLALFVVAAALLYRRSSALVLSFVAGCVPVVVAQVAYNLSVTGSALPPIFNPVVWADPSLPLYAPATTPVVGIYSAGQYARFIFDLVLGNKGILTFTPLILVMAYGLVQMRHRDALGRRLSIGIGGAFVTLFVLIVVFQNDEISRNFGERRFVDLFFVGGIALGPAFAAARSVATVVAQRVLLGISMTIAALGTVAPFGGEQGQNGFAFAALTFGEIAHRSPFQAAGDVLLLALLLTLVLRLPRPMPGAVSRVSAGRRRG
jgi:hypothetical protein